MKVQEWGQETVWEVSKQSHSVPASSMVEQLHLWQFTSVAASLVNWGPPHLNFNRAILGTKGGCTPLLRLQFWGWHPRWLWGSIFPHGGMQIIL